MLKCKSFLIVLMLSLFAWSPAFAGVQYIEAPPISQVVHVPAGTVGAGVINVPLITWGGDIATVYANGNNRNTTSGSIFDKQGLKLRLTRDDVFANQVKAYIKGETPFLRGTMGMINMAIEALDHNPNIRPIVIYQMTWSTGGDALVVKSNIKSPKDLKGKTICLQAYGPHVDYLAKILADAGLKMTDVNIKWVKDLVNADNTPGNALYESNIDAVMVIIPIALELTSGGTVGSGAESVKGARILLSTKSADRVISDVYAVRADYFESNRAQVEKFVHGLLLGQETLVQLVKDKTNQPAAYQQMISASADILLGDSTDIANTEGMYADCTYVGFDGNVKFFADSAYRRSFEILTKEIQASFVQIGILNKGYDLAKANWDYNNLKAGLNNVNAVVKPRFDSVKVASAIDKKAKQGTLDSDKQFVRKVFFQPNQNSFSAEMYKNDFDEIIDLASTYGGAIITVEGNSDPLGYLKSKKKGSNHLILSRIKQSAKNLSRTRANAVRDALIQYAKSKGVTLDPSQFTPIGWGIDRPSGGMCGADPCAPKTKQEWLNNMRVEFSVVNVEAESSTFELVD